MLEHAANTESPSTGSFVPVSLTPNARRQARRPSRTMAIEAAGSFASWSHFGIPAVHPSISESREGSLAPIDVLHRQAYCGETRFDQEVTA